jgi:chromosome segregation ATPase
MKDISVLVGNVRKKVEKLTEKQILLTKSNEKLSIEVIKINEELTEKKQQISELNDKIKLLKIARSVGGDGTKEVKLKINEMVREIDKCIAQINR